MESQFDIYQSSTAIERPPISHKVRDYFVQFFINNVISRKRILVNSKWSIILAIFFIEEGGRYISKDILLAKGGPRTIKKDRIKLYEILIPMKLIEEASDPYLRTIELMYAAIKIFFTSTYKKVTTEFVDELWQEVDLEYLMALPYPAPMSEQKYIGDIAEENGEVKTVDL